MDHFNSLICCRVYLLHQVEEYEESKRDWYENKLGFECWLIFIVFFFFWEIEGKLYKSLCGGTVTKFRASIVELCVTCNLLSSLARVITSGWMVDFLSSCAMTREIVSIMVSSFVSISVSFQILHIALSQIPQMYRIPVPF